MRDDFERWLEELQKKIEYIEEQYFFLPEQSFTIFSI